MVVLQGRTREQIRQSVGYSVGGMQILKASADGATVSSGTTTFLTVDIIAAADDHNGSWLWGTGTNQTGKPYRVTDTSYVSPTTTLNIIITDGGTAVKPVTGDTGELWGRKFNPAIINEFINQAIIEATGRVYDPEESLALHGDGRTRRFDIPSEFAMLRRVDYRARVDSKVVHDADSAWDEASAPSNVTRSLDTEHYRTEPANKFVIAGAFTTGLVSSKAVSSMDLSGYDYIEFWIESTTATAAGDFTLLLDDTAACVSALETLSIPALTADTPTFVRIALANPDLDTAIISVGLNAAVNIGANTIWIRKVRAVKESNAQWVTLDRRSWRVDVEARDLILTNDACAVIGAKLLKLVGGDKPVLLSADATVTEVDDQYIIARATELTLRACGHAREKDPEAVQRLISDWERKALMVRSNLPPLVGVRLVG